MCVCVTPHPPCDSRDIRHHALSVYTAHAHDAILCACACVSGILYAEKNEMQLTVTVSDCTIDIHVSLLYSLVNALHVWIMSCSRARQKQISQLCFTQSVKSKRLYVLCSQRNIMALWCLGGSNTNSKCHLPLDRCLSKNGYFLHYYSGPLSVSWYLCSPNCIPWAEFPFWRL